MSFYAVEYVVHEEREPVRIYKFETAEMRQEFIEFAYEQFRGNDVYEIDSQKAQLIRALNDLDQLNFVSVEFKRAFSYKWVFDVYGSYTLPCQITMKANW